MGEVNFSGVSRNNPYYNCNMDQGVCYPSEDDYLASLNEDVVPVAPQPRAAQPVKKAAPQRVVSANFGQRSGSEEAAAAMGFLEGMGQGIASMFNLACASTEQNIDCEKAESFYDRSLNVQTQTRVAMTLTNGQIDVVAESRIDGQDQILAQGDLYLSFNSDNSRLGADENGNLIYSDSALPQCKEELVSCSPFYGTSGLVPVGTPKVNADGAYMLKELDGETYAVFGHMRDLTYGELVYEAPFSGKTVNVVRHRVVDWDAETEMDVWLEVDGNGYATETEVVVDEASASSLPAHFAYYETDGQGNYIDTTKITIDGQEVVVPRPDSTLNDITFEVLLAEGEEAFNLRDIYMGRRSDPEDATSEWLIEPIVEEEAGEMNWENIRNYEIPMSYSLEIRDNRPAPFDPQIVSAEALAGSGAIPPADTDVIDGDADAVDGDADVYEGEDVEETAEAAQESTGLLPGEILLNRGFYSNGQMDLTVKVRYTGDMSRVIPNMAYVYRTIFGASARVRISEKSECQ